jgi:hypothetical protein
MPDRELTKREQAQARQILVPLSTKTPSLVGIPGGPSGTFNNDLSESEFNKLMRGGKFEGQYQTVVNTAHANNIPASLMASILAFETGYGKSRAVNDYNNPAGLMAGGRDNKEFMKFETIEEGIAKAGEVQKRLYEQGGQTIPGMAKIYAPVKPDGSPVANDPHGTNKQWPGTVARLQNRFQEYSGPEEGAGKGLRLDPGGGSFGGGGATGVAELDAVTPTVNGNGKLAVDVNAPKGVSVKAEGEGVFNKTETNRQMEPMTQ